MFKMDIICTAGWPTVNLGQNQARKSRLLPKPSIACSNTPEMEKGHATKFISGSTLVALYELVPHLIYL